MTEDEIRDLFVRIPERSRNDANWTLIGPAAFVYALVQRGLWG